MNGLVITCLCKQRPFLVADLQDREAGSLFVQHVQYSPRRFTFPWPETQLADRQMRQPAAVLRGESVALGMLSKLLKGGLQFVEPRCTPLRTFMWIVFLVPLKLFFDAVFSLG